MEIHHSVTLARVMDAVSRRRTQLDDPGFCLHCGADADGIEPDAHDYECRNLRPDQRLRGRRNLYAPGIAVNTQHTRQCRPSQRDGWGRKAESARALNDHPDLAKYPRKISVDQSKSADACADDWQRLATDFPTKPKSDQPLTEMTKSEPYQIISE